MNKALSYTALRSEEPTIRMVVGRLLAPLVDDQPWDLAAAAAGFPMAFAGTLMGLPEEERPMLTRWTTMAAAPDDSMFADDNKSDALTTAHIALFEYFAAQIRQRSRQRRDDLIGFLMTMEANGRRLTNDEIIYNCYSLLLGANVTTPHAFAGMALALIENPDQYDMLCSGVTNRSTAIEEGLRWSSPANHFMRYAARDTTLSGVRVGAGEAVVAWLGSANRDEEVFTDPYRFDVNRSPNRHLAFGLGVHYCIGAPLARIALNVLLDELTGSVERLELAGPPEHVSSNFIAGIKHMPVTARLVPAACDALIGARDAGGPLPVLDS